MAEPDLFESEEYRRGYKAGERLMDDICASRHMGNPLSVQANKIAHKGKVGARERIISHLVSLGDYGLICEQIETDLQLSHQTCSARLSELRREGKIKIVGTRKTRSGSPAAIYQST